MKYEALAYLTEEDWAALMERATRSHHSRNELIFEAGARHRSLYFVVEGIVRVERATSDGAVVFATVGPGQVFGEMAFLEDAVASASTVADGDVVLDVVDEDSIHALLESLPGFATRFYRSLAPHLSGLLRATSQRLYDVESGLSLGRDSGRRQRAGQITGHALPSELSAALDSFKSEIASLDAALLARTLRTEAAQARVDRACDGVVELLDRFTAAESLLDIGASDLLAFRGAEDIESGVGGAIFRESFPFFMLSATLSGCQGRQRGLADRFETLELFYENQPLGDGSVGALIDRWFLARPLARSAREARDRMAALIASTLEEAAGSITSLLCGRADEVFEAARSGDAELGLFTGIDPSPRSVALARTAAEQAGLSDRVTLIQESIARLVEARGPVRLAPQRLIYGLHCCHALDADAIGQLLAWAHRHLEVGGTLALGFLEPGHPDQRFTGHILEWQENAYSEADIDALFSSSPFGSPPETVLDEPGVHRLATCVRKG